MRHISEAELPTRFGDFRLHAFVDSDGREHMALISGHPALGCLVRVHSECATGDIFGSMRCDCGFQLETSLEMISRSGNGMLIYVRGHEGRGIGLANKISAYALQEKGLDTAEANLKLGFPVDGRDYSAAAAILRHFGVTEISLITNNRDKIRALEDSGIKVRKRIGLWADDGPHNARYLNTKRDVMGHMPKEKGAT